MAHFALGEISDNKDQTGHDCDRVEHGPFDKGDGLHNQMGMAEGPVQEGDQREVDKGPCPAFEVIDQAKCQRQQGQNER